MFYECIYSARLPLAYYPNDVFKDFSLQRWIENRGMDASERLTEVAISQLLEALGVAPYLREQPCQRAVAPYSPTTHGWYTGK
jgi:hypothetical protein